MIRLVRKNGGVSMKVIAKIHSDFPSKFGIPRQSGLVDTLTARIIFEPEYRDANAVRGLDGFSHIWLIWEFSKSVRDTWSPTVKPPRLGGNTRMGVFATRSPFRPNPIGLSCVLLERIEYSKAYGPILHVRGADLLDQTPIYDIKPYLPYTESHPDAKAGFAAEHVYESLDVEIEEQWLTLIPVEKQDALIKVLRQDPRPSYQQDASRIYGMEFAGFEVKFTVEENRLKVYQIGPIERIVHEVRYLNDDSFIQ